MSLFQYALLVTANRPETALYRAPTFSLLLVSHGGISSCGSEREREREKLSMVKEREVGTHRETERRRVEDGIKE